MDPNSPIDAVLVADALAGNREAFGQLYDRYARIVRSVVAGVSGDWSAVEDMTQECFLRAYRLLPKLRDADRFGPWIAGIARQVGRERLRTLRRERVKFGPQLADAKASIDSQANVAARDELDIVIRRVAHLPEQERLAIHSFFFQQQGAKDAANVVGLSRSGFYALLQRALAQLAVRTQSSSVAKTPKQSVE
jgi:RNA polymerase sigma-70 factor (ECF subfamily)